MSVFITGASSGIGEACARTFAAAGHHLVLVARRKDRLEQLKQVLQSQYQVRCNTFELDVRDRSRLNTLMSQYPEIFEEVEILINNAGLAKGLDLIQEGRAEDWDVMIDTNIKGLLSVTQAFLPKLISKGQGHIVNLGSVAGHWVYPKGNIYCATKYAVRALTESLRIDLAGTGIRVTEISPGMVETEFSEVRFSGDRQRAKAVYEGRKPLKATDIAETILWCIQRPQHVNIQEIVIFPTDQPSVQPTPIVKR